MKMIFCMQINIKVSYKSVSTLLVSKFPTRWYYHNWCARPSILKVLKVKRLQYLYSISKKKLGMEFIHCMQINIEVSTSWQGVQSCPKYPKQEVRNIFAVYWEKSVATAYMCSIVMQNIRIFYGVSVIFVDTCLIQKAEKLFMSIVTEAATRGVLC